MKRILSVCLVLLLALTLLPAGALAAEEARSVSLWAEEEILRAEGYGLLDVGELLTDYEGGETVTDWRQPITRAMFVRFALSYAAAMNHSDRACFQPVSGHVHDSVDPASLKVEAVVEASWIAASVRQAQFSDGADLPAHEVVDH